LETAKLSLFEDDSPYLSYAPPEDSLTVVSGDIESIGGLSYIPEFITSGEERVLLWEADRQGDWSKQWSRRTKSFGSRYLSVDEESSEPRRSMPQWTGFVRQRLVERGIMERLPNQMGVNEYMPGQGIAAHIDHCGGTVVSLSLGSGCVMEFTVPGAAEKTASMWLPRRSIVVLRGAARNVWHHGIRGRLKDVVAGHVIKRDRRVSLTFRDVTAR
jgi:alkylated DNA repair dioxygenase AlkB